MQSPVRLLEHPSSCMSCKFIWPSTDACPPAGPVSRIGSFSWPLVRVVTGDSGSWKHLGHCQFDWLHLVDHSIWNLTCNKGVGFIALHEERKTKFFSMIRKCPKSLLSNSSIIPRKWTQRSIFSMQFVQIMMLKFCLQWAAKLASLTKFPQWQKFSLIRPLKCLRIHKDGIKINANVNAKNWLTKKCVIKDLIGILAIVHVNVINYVMLENI